MSDMNKITSITRRNIADEMLAGRMWYHGRLSEPDFLSRLYDLSKMPSKDYRYNNAYDDIHKHTVMNNDWDANWVYSDNRFNLSHNDDKRYLEFLSETLHPTVRNDDEEISKIVALYNKHLQADGYVVAQVGDISGKPVFAGQELIVGHSRFSAKSTEIKKYLNTEYVNGKIDIMNQAVNKDSDLAIGTAKELLETACKSILKQKGITIDPNWTLPKLINETTGVLDFKPKEADEPDKAEKSIKQILGGVSTIVHGVAELRNAYGTGHGKDADFKGLETKYAKLLVGVVSEIVIIFLTTNGEAELVENLP